MTHHMHPKVFLVGAIVGSLLGGTAALLSAPKAGKKIREDIHDACCDLSDRTQDMAKKGKSLAKNVSCQTYDWACKAKSIVDGVTKSVKGLIYEEEEENSTTDLLIGGLAGGVLGAVVGLLLAPKTGCELRQDLVDTYEDVSERTQEFATDVSKKGKAFAKTARSKTNKWLNLAKQIVDDLTDEAQETGEGWKEQVKDFFNNDRMNHAIELASLGYRLWQGAASKR